MSNILSLHGQSMQTELATGCHARGWEEPVSSPTSAQNRPSAFLRTFHLRSKTIIKTKGFKSSQHKNIESTKKPGWSTCMQVKTSTCSIQESLASIEKPSSSTSSSYTSHTYSHQRPKKHEHNVTMQWCSPTANEIKPVASGRIPSKQTRASIQRTKWPIKGCVHTKNNTKMANIKTLSNAKRQKQHQLMICDNHKTKP